MVSEDLTCAATLFGLQIDWVYVYAFVLCSILLPRQPARHYVSSELYCIIVRTLLLGTYFP